MNQITEINGVGLFVQHEAKPDTRYTLVFLHDSLGCAVLWRDFPQQLAQKTDCAYLVYDRQGYGQSAPFGAQPRQQDYMEKEADVLAALLEQLGIGNAVLFGHSDGGTIALLAAAKYPEIVVGVVTEGAHVFVEEITLKGIREAVESYQTTNLPEKLAKYHGSKTDGVFWAWAATWLSEMYRDWNIEHFLPKIQCPVLVIQGENDEFGTLAQVEAIVSQVSGQAEQLILPAVGHNPHKEAQAETIEVVAAFLQTF
ncbi:alpha/beta fold hydrolase [Flexibacter flexilis]|nr:alpha/beta hydrolase [Flexibacter flexilis]